MSLKRAVPLLISFPVLILTPYVARAGAWTLKPGEYYTEIRGSHRSAATAHDSTGARVLFGFGGNREERELVSYTEIGWKKALTFVLAIPAVSRTVNFDPPLRPLTRTGLSDLLLGLRLKLINGPTAMAAEAEWKAPLGYDRDVFPALGDGQQDVSGRLLFGAPIAGRGFIDAGAGYRYRFEDPLNEILATADLGIWLGPSLLAAGRYDYTKSVGTGDVLGQEYQAHLVGPQLTYRVDDRLDVFAGSTHTASARNFAHFDRYYVGVAVKHTALDRLQGFLGGKQRR